MPEEIVFLIFTAMLGFFYFVRMGMKNRHEARLAKYRTPVPALPDQASTDLNAKVSRLEKRLAVIERITTEPSQRLAVEIDELGKLERT